MPAAYPTRICERCGESYRVIWHIAAKVQRFCSNPCAAAARWEQRKNRPTTDERFWAKVNLNGPVPTVRPDLGPCWLWEAACRIEDGGYGAFWDGKKTVRAHRWAYEQIIGPFPEGLQPDHLCRVSACINPFHLEPVTSGENTRRGIRARAS